jgi:uncharacterized protein YjbI with pentapeptide repeats
MVPALAAPVRPRVLIPHTTGALLLEDAVSERLDDRRWGTIELIGLPGAGKSVALAHLAHAFHDYDRLLLADCPDESARQSLIVWANKRLVVYASPNFTEVVDTAAQWRLAPWLEDEWIEYLLAVHHDSCASVMQRLKADPQRRRLGGTAGLWRIVLDRLATDGSLDNTKSALQRELHERLRVAARARASKCAFDVLVTPRDSLESARQLLETAQLDSIDRRVLCYGPVIQLLAAEHLASQLRADATGAILKKQLPEPLVRETAELLRSDELAISHLRQILACNYDQRHSMAASLLHAAVDWVPDNGSAPILRMAFLAGAQWRGVRLSKLELYKADLSGADLSECQLSKAYAHDSNLSRINFHGARLVEFNAVRANLTWADLSFVRAAEANLRSCDLSDANLEGALLTQADFGGADLRRARFRRANLCRADFNECELEEADFSGADLSWTKFWSAPLRLAEFAGANFAHATLNECDMENMSLPGADFTGAWLCGSYLTGSRIPAAKFGGANLRNTRLAHIDWPDADLRAADLRAATFHMGSSRSGLVGSPIACEGSRTGFYTDEYLEQDFKSPEEIRKANLCGADLRGADIDHVDFYLVDLRGAKYTAEQEIQLRATGAILESRV